MSSLVESITHALTPPLATSTSALPQPLTSPVLVGTSSPAAHTPLPTAQTSMFKNEPLMSHAAYGVDDGWDHHGNWHGRRTSKSYPGVYTGKQVGYHTTYTPKRVLIVHDDGTKQPFTLTYADEPWLPLARQVWPGTDHEVEIPKAHGYFTYAEPTFNPCVFTAADQYLQARWGRRLDDSDRRWLAAHPLSTDAGVPQEYTTTCVAQLVEPYGMRISRIRIRAGSMVLGDQVMAWLQALGCNPMAMADRRTSNAEAAAMLSMSVEQANQLWRVEFHEDPLPCSIIGERGYAQPGVATGAYGGHARYLAPRARAGDWFISLQLDMDTQTQYLVAPPSPEYVPRKGLPTLQLSGVTDPEGAPIAVRGTTGGWRRAGTPEPTAPTTYPVTTYPATTLTAPAPSSSSSVTGPIASVTPTPKTVPVRGKAAKRRSRSAEKMMKAAYHDVHACTICTTLCAPKDLYTNPATSDDPQVCWDCVITAWEGMHCPHCKQTFSQTVTPYEMEVEDGRQWLWECPACRDLMIVTPQDDLALVLVSTMLLGDVEVDLMDPADQGAKAALEVLQAQHDPDVPFNFID